MTIRDALNFYKSNFSKCWDGEKYKWVAVQHFKEHWDIEAEDFAGMLEESFSQTYNLLQGGMYYAYKMVYLLARTDPEKMRGLFRLLYNEDLPLVERLQPFRTGCDELMEKFRQSIPDHGDDRRNGYPRVRTEVYHG